MKIKISVLTTEISERCVEVEEMTDEELLEYAQTYPTYFDKYFQDIVITKYDEKDNVVKQHHLYKAYPDMINKQPTHTDITNKTLQVAYKLNNASLNKAE